MWRRAIRAPRLADQNQTAASLAFTVSALASTPYNVAVGGTDFSDTYFGHEWQLTEYGKHCEIRFRASYAPGDSVERLLHRSLLAAYEANATSVRQFCNARAGCWPPLRDRNYGCGRRRPKRLRNGTVHQWSSERIVRRLSQAVVATSAG